LEIESSILKNIQTQTEQQEEEEEEEEENSK